MGSSMEYFKISQLTKAARQEATARVFWALLLEMRRFGKKPSIIWNCDYLEEVKSLKTIEVSA